jgi:hypothetical protein
LNIRRPDRQSLRVLMFCCACVALPHGYAWADDDNTVVQRGMLPERDGRWSLGVTGRAEESAYRG